MSIDEEKRESSFPLMHLQWFAPEGEDDGGAGDPPEMTFEGGDEDEVEIVVSDNPTPEEGPEEYRGLDRQALIEQMAALRSQQEELSRRGDSTAALAASFQGLQDALLNQNKAPTRDPYLDGAPGKSYEELQKELAEKFYDDPTKAVDTLVQHKMAPLMRTLLTNNVNMSKRLMMMEPENKTFYEKYREEVDQELVKIPPDARLNDGEVYTKALQVVQSRHIDDIVAIKVAEAMKTMAGGMATAPTYTEPGGGRTPASPPAGVKKRVVHLSTAEAEYARVNAMSPQMMARALEANPELRERIKARRG